MNGIKNLNINMGLDPGPNSPESLDPDQHQCIGMDTKHWKQWGGGGIR
jgi:hypothetical protein